MTEEIPYYTGPGSAYRVWEVYKKSEYDASGEKPVIKKPNPEEQKKKSIN